MKDLEVKKTILQAKSVFENMILLYNDDDVFFFLSGFYLSDDHLKLNRQTLLNIRHILAVKE